MKYGYFFKDEFSLDPLTFQVSLSSLAIGYLFWLSLGTGVCVESVDISINSVLYRELT